MGRIAANQLVLILEDNTEDFSKEVMTERFETMNQWYKKQIILEWIEFLEAPDLKDIIDRANELIREDQEAIIEFEDICEDCTHYGEDCGCICVKRDPAKGKDPIKSEQLDYNAGFKFRIGDLVRITDSIYPVEVGMEFKVFGLSQAEDGERCYQTWDGAYHRESNLERA